MVCLLICIYFFFAFLFYEEVFEVQDPLERMKSSKHVRNRAHTEAEVGWLTTCNF